MTGATLYLCEQLDDSVFVFAVDGDAFLLNVHAAFFDFLNFILVHDKRLLHLHEAVGGEQEFRVFE